LTESTHLDVLIHWWVVNNNNYCCSYYYIYYSSKCIYELYGCGLSIPSLYTTGRLIVWLSPGANTCCIAWPLFS